MFALVMSLTAIGVLGFLVGAFAAGRLVGFREATRQIRKPITVRVKVEQVTYDTPEVHRG